MFLPVPSASSLDKVAREAKVDDLCLTLLQQLTEQNRGPFSHRQTSNKFVPTVFAQTPEAKAAGIKKPELTEALERLLNAKKIGVETYGPPSRNWARLVRK